MAIKNKSATATFLLLAIATNAALSKRLGSRINGKAERLTQTATTCETLAQAIIKDNMPPSSDQCVHTPGSTSSSFDFVSSQEESQWFDGYDVSFAEYNAPWSQLEQYVFNAKMSYTDSNSDRSWTMRLGTGGNIYSLVGPMGETVSSQKRDDSPWIDEVWHSVSTDPILNSDSSSSMFMIHGAGSYQSDKSYQSDRGIPVTTRPFYSPSLGKYCDDETGECGFVAWPQHGPIHVEHKSTVINFNRYKNCDSGVFEHTAVVHNNMGNDYWTARIDAPLGSIRFSNLRDVVVTNKATNAEELIKPHELAVFDQPEAFKREAKDTLGYAIFAEDLPSKESGSYPLAPGVNIQIHQIGCQTAPDFWGYPVVMCRIEPTTEDLSGTRVALTFRGTPKQIEPPCDQSNPNNCITGLKFIKYGSGQYCRPFGSSYSCRLDNAYLNNFINAGGDSNSIEFKTSSGKIFTASVGVINWSIEYNGIYSLIYNRAESDTTMDEINAMMDSEPNAVWQIEATTPPGAGGDVHARNGTPMWVNHIEETGAYWFYFYADPIEGVGDLGAYVAEKFPPGSTIEVLYHTGKPEEENTALAHVYGNEFSNVNGLTEGWPLVWIGNAHEGAKPRDLNVYNIVTTANLNNEGGIHHYRQYFVMDRFTEISSRAKSLVNQVETDNYNVRNTPAPISRSIDLIVKDGSIVNSVVGNSNTAGAVCTGSTTPKSDSKALFYVKCGGSTYIGADPYYFSPIDWLGLGNLRPYICKNDPTVRGEWTLLGFFVENSCASIETGYTFSDDIDTCSYEEDVSESPSAAPVPAASDAPSLNPSAAPVPAASDSPSLNPSAAPVPVTSNSPSQNPSAEPITDTSDAPSLNPSAAPVPAASDSPSQNPSAEPITDTSNSPSLNPSAAPVPVASNSPSQNPSAASVTDTSDSPSNAPVAALFINPATVTLNTEGAKPQIEVSHNVASGAGGIEVTLYQYDCVTPVPADDAVYIVDSLTNLGDDAVAEYVIEFDKDTIGSSDLLVGANELKFCIMAGLEDGVSGEILVYSSSRIKLTFDLGYALFFVDVTGAAPNDYDLGDISLFQMNACVCSISFTCDADPPLLQENTLVSLCLWPSSPGVMFTDFTMDIEGKNNGYSYSPITVANGAQVLDDYTVLQQQNDMWMVTTMLLPGLFGDGSNMAVISGGGYLEFITSKDEVLKEEKEYTLVVALEEPDGNPIDCLFSQIGKVMKIEIASSPVRVVGKMKGK